MSLLPPVTEDLFRPDPDWQGKLKGLGWSLAFVALFVVAIVAIVLVQDSLLHQARAAGAVRSSVAAMARDEFLQTLALFAVLTPLAWKTRTTVQGLGFGGQGLLRALGLGAATGLALISLILIGLVYMSMARFGALSPLDTRALTNLFEFTALFALVPLLEEGMMRSFLLNQLSRIAGFWPAALATSVIFMLTHVINPNETPLGLANVALVGLVLAWSRLRTGSLWFAIGFHAGWDWAQSYVFGVADSGQTMPGALLSVQITGPVWLAGGATGPEGGVLCSLALVALAAVVLWFWPKQA
jgi:membrane protease YdiL (CAAX protease family)